MKLSVRQSNGEEAHLTRQGWGDEPPRGCALSIWLNTISSRMWVISEIESKPLIGNFLPDAFTSWLILRRARLSFSLSADVDYVDFGRASLSPFFAANIVRRAQSERDRNFFCLNFNLCKKLINSEGNRKVFIRWIGKLSVKLELKGIVVEHCAVVQWHCKEKAKQLEANPFELSQACWVIKKEIEKIFVEWSSSGKQMASTCCSTTL